MSSSMSPVDYQARRKRVMSQIGNDALLILYANPEQTRSNDTQFSFRQNSDLLYLCGFPEPEAVLVLAPGAEHETILFVRPRDREREVWDGYRVGPEGAEELFGADVGYTIAQLDEVMPGILSGRNTVYHELGQSSSRDARLLRWMAGLKGTRRQRDLRPRQIADPSRVLHPMRMRKDAREIERLRVACEISAQGHLAAMQQAQPGWMEYQIEAVLSASFRSQGASGHSYEPIVAGGERACVLHYGENNRRIVSGDLVLIDAGAEFEHYAGDITRTWPMDASFTGPQREVYEAVLDAQKLAIGLTVVGESNLSVHDRTAERLAENLLQLGILKGSLEEVMETQSYTEYFMHGTGHYLGLDVHDVGVYRDDTDAPYGYEPGMVITVEPGLYIRADSGAPEHFHGIGVRIEDDILVCETGNENLTLAVPKEVSEIEQLRRASLKGLE